MADETQIANMALTELGQQAIMGLDDGSKAARLAKLRFTDTRDAVLRDFPWRCARRRVSLAADAAKPAFDFANAFTLPGDCLRVHRLADSSIRYMVEGGKLLADAAAPLKLIYIAAITPDLYDAALAQAHAFRLAAALAYGLTSRGEIRESMWRLYQDHLRSARSTSSMEGTPEEIEAGELLGARY